MKHVNIKDPDVDGEITTASWVWVSKLLPGDGWQFPRAAVCLHDAMAQQHPS